ncbi:MAG: hypothetical protein LBC03_05620 [Nitrososphaerota archaeon]|nr:hypothetical protein [Nitrososphaerota archaeon]
MQCLYLDGKTCWACTQIATNKYTQVLEVNTTDKEKYCQTENFENCPRLKTMIALKK